MCMVIAAAIDQNDRKSTLIADNSNYKPSVYSINCTDGQFMENAYHVSNYGKMNTEGLTDDALLLEEFGCFWAIPFGKPLNACDQYDRGRVQPQDVNKVFKV